MGVEVLTSYGTGVGLKAWSLVPEITALSDGDAQSRVDRAHTLLPIYGSYDGSKPNFATLIVELVYYTAEALHFWSQNIRAIVSPMRAERIGSYSYDKGAGTSRQAIVEEHEMIWPLIIHLKDHSDPSRVSISTRVVQVLSANQETGIRDMVIGSYSNRTQRAIEAQGIVSDTDEFNALVYGDRSLGWSSY